MDFSNIIHFLEGNISTLSNAFYEQVEHSKELKTYRQIDKSIVIERAENVFNQLINWLKTGASNVDAEKYFESVGSERFQEGFPITEVINALYVTKKIFWSFIAWKEELFNKYDYLQIIEYMTVLNNFFDIGNIFIIKGYVNELINKIDESSEYSKEEIKKFLLK